MDLSRFNDLFLTESREHLAAAAGLLADDPDGVPAGATLDDLFRHMHSLKGMAATMGCDDMARVAHAVEDVLQAVRDGGLQTAGVPRSALWEAVEQMNAVVDAWADPRRAPLPAASGLVERLRALAGNEVPATSRPTSPCPVERPSTRTYDVELEVVTAPALRDTVGTLGTIRALGKLGTIVRFDPPPTYVRDGEAPAWTLVVRSERTPDEVRTAATTVPGVVRVEARERPREFGRAPRRTPRGYLRVRAEDADAIHEHARELRVAQDKLLALARGCDDPDLVREVRRCRSLAARLGDRIRDLRMVPFETIEPRLRAGATTAAQAFGTDVHLVVEGRDVGIDRSILEALGDPLLHLVRNAVAHGIERPDERARLGKPESGRIRIAIVHDRQRVRIEVGDDGRGLDLEALRRAARGRGVPEGDLAGGALTDEAVLDLLSRPGLSTARGHGPECAGRGVGMDVVRREVGRLGGSLRVRSEAGRGTTFRIDLPAASAVVPSVLLRAGGDAYAVPSHTIERTLAIDPASLRRRRDGIWIEIGGDLRPLRSLRRHLDPRVSTDDAPRPGAPVLVPRSTAGRRVYHVDEIVGRRDLVVQPIDGRLVPSAWLGGATLLEDGSLVLVLGDDALA